MSENSRCGSGCNSLTAVAADGFIGGFSEAWRSGLGFTRASPLLGILGRIEKLAGVGLSLEDTISRKAVGSPDWPGSL